jgi:hypothetical protein
VVRPALDHSHFIADPSSHRQLIHSTQALLFKQRVFQPPARVAYWQQLRESNPSRECVSLLTTHLWLSSLLARPNSNIFYLDPILIQELVTQFEADPLDETIESIPWLFDRQRLWPRTRSTVHVLALAQPTGVCDPGVESWILLDMVVKCGCVKTVEVLLPPSQAFDVDLFAWLVSQLMGALNCILPRSVIQHSSAVQQTLKVLVLPQPQIQDAVALLMVAYFCGKLLDQAVDSVDIGVFRQSVCYYYNHALRLYEVDSSFPWPALTDADGTLLTTQSSNFVRQRRFSLVTNRESSPFETFPRRRSYIATVTTPGPSAPFFLELSQQTSSHSEGMLIGTSGRSIEELEKATLLGPYPSWPDSLPDHSLQVPDALSLDQFVELIQSLGGPQAMAVHKLLLIGKHEGKRIKLDWLKEATYPDKDWLMVGWDVDSLSMTTLDVPELLESGSYYPYPSRSLSLTNRNELQVNVNGKILDMHTCGSFINYVPLAHN